LIGLKTEISEILNKSNQNCMNCVSFLEVVLEFTIQYSRVVILLSGGDKSTQTKDIEKATKLLSEIAED